MAVVLQPSRNNMQDIFGDGNPRKWVVQMLVLLNRIGHWQTD